MENEINIFDEDEIVIDRIAETQGEIYQDAYDRGFDMEDFSEKYLCSEFCRKEMDSYSILQLEIGTFCMEFFMDEMAEKGITLKAREKDIFYSPVWVGRMYRYLFYAMQKTSKELNSLLPLSTLALYDAELSECTYPEAVKYLVNKIKEEIK